MRIKYFLLSLWAIIWLLFFWGCASNTRQKQVQTTQMTSPDQDFQTQISKVVTKHESEIKFCYEKELKKSQNLTGIITVGFTIEPNGLVSEAEIKNSTIDNGPLELCLTGFVKKWTFPPPKDKTPVKVIYPFVFRKE